MFKKSLLTVFLATLSFSSFAQPVAGVNYMHFYDDKNNFELSLGAVTANFGYELSLNEKFNLLPLLRIGTGFGDDVINAFSPAGTGNVEVKLQHFIAISIRGEYQVSPKIYLFIAPSYADIKYEGGNLSTNDEFGFGGGFGYDFSPKVSGELGYERFDEADVLSLGAQFHF